ncbi:TIGR03620 family F420-dependent LLM class oxidoreductase [Mycolicibacterium sp.]|uniref:TIGR03620 family F420-dependent LLM class oxidoreductase n=1 Tax=Mycolicibacterium sp. TaxID=2320850 RepID=UPI003D13EDE6
MTKPDLGEYGVFILGGPSPQEAKEIENLGYTTVWVAGSPQAGLGFAEPLLDATETLRVATGIVNIWTADPATVAESFHRIERTHPGRFVLGIGPGHPELHQQYRKPLDAVRDYLDKLDEYGVPPDRRVLAALGPGALELAARRAAGVHSYLATPEHTARARAVLGPQALLAPEHKVVLSTDTAHARAAGRAAFATSIQKANYRNNFRRLGFTEADLADGGSDRLVDAVVAHGDAEAITTRLTSFLAAGADHIPVQVFGGDRLRVLAELAGPLGLR